MADGGCRTVAGEDMGFIGEGQQTGVDRVDDLAGVAAGQVGAADASGKKRIAGDEHLERGKVEADRALGMAGGVEDLGGVTIEAHELAVGERGIGRGGFRGWHAEPCGLGGHHFEQGQIAFVEEYGRAREALELERSAYVVDVGVGDENLLELEVEFGEAALDAGDFVAGIDNDGFAGFLVAEDGAVAGERADGEGFQDHDSYSRPVPA